MAINFQAAVKEYHDMIGSMGGDMHVFHARWHTDNQDPIRPARPDVNWAMNNTFGNDFFQMHHEMVKAKESEPKYFMHHPSIVDWFNSQGYGLPPQWDPLTPIPAELAYVASVPAMQRLTDNPQFALPKCYTIEGSSSAGDIEPITRSQKLSDFKSMNQLGCCIIFPHNKWHSLIGGAMKNPGSAINDPIFYFGVHWHIDKIFDDYKTLLSNSSVGTNSNRYVPDSFTDADLKKLKTREELGLTS